MVRLTGVIAIVLLSISPAWAQEPGVLAIDEEAGRYAFSFRGEADALNMCGTTGCEVVATFSACLGLGYSSPTQGRNVWTWVEAATEGAARQGALDECQRAGGPACEVLNVFCAEAPAVEASAAPDSAQENLFWQSIRESTDRRTSRRTCASIRAARSGRWHGTGWRGWRRRRARRRRTRAVDRRRRSSAATPCAPSVRAASRAGWRWRTGRVATSGTRIPSGKTVTWTGGCSDGFAEGSGSLRWAFGGAEQVATGGRLQGGRMDGTWSVTEQGPDGRDPRRFEATFADGRPQAEEPAAAPAGQSGESQEPPRPAVPRPQEPPRPPRPPSAAAGRACEIPGFPTPSDSMNLGLRWCGSNVGFQRRVFALQAAGAWCAIAGGTSSSPAQVRARHQEINVACDRLDALEALNQGRGPSCRCPRGYRP